MAILISNIYHISLLLLKYPNFPTFRELCTYTQAVAYAKALASFSCIIFKIRYI